jgi:hypothetical protein
MVDYVPPSTSQVSPKRPGTVEWGRAADERPIAIADGAPGAPRIAPIAFAGLFLGQIQTTSASPGGFNDLDRFEQIMMVGGRVGATTQPQIRFSTDNGASWGSWQSFGLVLEGDHLSFVLQKSLNRIVVLVGVEGATTTLSIPSAANAFQVRPSSSGVDLMRLNVFLLGGTP